MVDGALLHRTISAYERLENDRKDLAEDQAQVVKDAVEAGLDKKALKALLRELRRNDPTADKLDRDMLDEYREVYATWESTPLGSHAKGATEPMDGKAQMKRARDKSTATFTLTAVGGE
jgi:uncharacterized protein (UPF0335 family)